MPDHVPAWVVRWRESERRADHRAERGREALLVAARAVVRYVFRWFRTGRHTYSYTERAWWARWDALNETGVS